jgi:hypothetical protein
MKKDRIEDVYGALGGFSKEPPKELWDKIEITLHPKKKKRRLFFLWGFAAAVLLVFVGYTIANAPGLNLKPVKGITDIENNKASDAISETEIETIKKVDETFNYNINEDFFSEKHITKEKLLNNVANQNQLSARSSLQNKEEVEKNSARPNIEKIINNKGEKSKYNRGYAQKSKEEKNDALIKKDIVIKLNENEITLNHEKEKLYVRNDSISKLTDNALVDLSEGLMAVYKAVSDSINPSAVNSLKWSVEVLGGLSNTASEASIQGASVNTTSQNDFVYTLKLGYSISDRLVLKSGIGKNVLGQEINNIRYASTDGSLLNTNFQNIVNNQSILFLVSQESINDFSTLAEVSNEGTLLQQFDYIQVPLEVSYTLLRAQKFDLSIGVGGHINFLTNNSAFLNNEQIGESLGVNATVFGATMNTNVSFELAKKTILFLEPSYNYFEKPIDNNNQTFSNNQLRVLFGLRYKF